MKIKLLFSAVILAFVLTLYVPPIFAQDSPQWHLPEGAKARLGKGEIVEIAYSPDGRRLAVGSSIGIWIYDTQTGQELDLLTGHRGSVRSVSFRPDGNTLATGSSDGTVLLWELAPAPLENLRLMRQTGAHVVFRPAGHHEIPVVFQKSNVTFHRGRTRG